MIETDPHDRTPARTQEDSRPTGHPAADPATAPAVGPAPASAVGPPPGSAVDPAVGPSVDPAAVLRVLIQRRQDLLHRETAELRSLRTYADRLAHELPPPPVLPPGPPAGVEVLTGAEAVEARLDTMLDSAETEVLVLDRSALTASRSGGLGKAGEAGEEAGACRIRRLLARGVAVRTVTDRRGTDFPERARELIALTRLGLQARIGQRLPTGLVLVDRRTCLLPPPPSDGGGAEGAALVFGGSLLHRAALPLFESLWARATPVGSPVSPLSAEQRELLGLLASGLKDESIARRLGVHVHTARRRITRMLEELDADTRFQAGVQAAIRGWLQPHPAEPQGAPR
ncbi:helix-turn-helix transcriptional regulator, partial [Streptomyces yangpuensis]|uniref:helix-turn-helix transcriptional regulator n=1 Tax=Streptomyces yangpuensis TaxID=1648182 RepID=UPI001428D22C